jgi:hypothetical protein
MAAARAETYCSAATALPCRWNDLGPVTRGVGDGAESSFEGFRGNTLNRNVGVFPGLTLSSCCQNPLRPSPLPGDGIADDVPVGVEHVGVHTLRHSAVVGWLEQGVHIKAVADLLEHSSISAPAVDRDPTKGRV